MISHLPAARGIRPVGAASGGNWAESIVFIAGCALVSPLWILALHAAFGKRQLTLAARIAISFSLAALFLNRQFGISLGAGAFDDVPQYLYLFSFALQYTLLDSLHVWTFEPGFIVVSRLISLITSSAPLYVFSIFFLCSALLVEGVSRLTGKRTSIALLCFFALFGVVFYGYMHLMRQTLALSLLVFAISFFVREQSRDVAKGLLLMGVACTMHVAALPVAVAVIAARVLWVRSKMLLLLGIVVTVPATLFMLDSVLSILIGYSGRLEVYLVRGFDQEVPVAQLTFAGASAAWLLWVALTRKLSVGVASLYYVIGLVGLLISAAAVLNFVPFGLLSRQLMAVLGLLSILSVAALCEGRSRRWLQMTVAVLLTLRFAAQIASGAPHLLPFVESGALSPWVGGVANVVLGFERPASDFPADFGLGGL